MPKRQHDKLGSAARRDFLRGSLAVGAGAAACALSGGAAAREAASATGPAPQGPAGYRVSSHVRAYYRAARF